MANSRTLLIRADAGSTRGLGHLMRCLSLAYGWKARGGSVLVLCAEGAEAVQDELAKLEAEQPPLGERPGSLEDAAATRRMAADRSASWLVVDGDHFTPPYLEAAKADGTRLLRIDDFGMPDASGVDLVLNPNLGATCALYPGTPAQRLLLGSRFVLLRPSFLPWRSWTRRVPALARRILVFMGGGDPDGSTGRVVRALASSREPWQVHVIEGPYSASADHLADDRFRFGSRVDDVPLLMSETDIAIIAAGGVLWELLFMGAGVLSFSRNDLQRDVVSDLAARGAAIELGDPSALEPSVFLEAVEGLGRSPGQRSRMAALGRDLVDGEGAARAIAAMRALTG